MLNFVPPNKQPFPDIQNLSYVQTSIDGCSQTILKDVISLIENNLGKKAKIKLVEKQQGDMEVTYADISKAKKLLGWSPEIDFKQGIKIFTEWFKNNKK